MSALIVGSVALIVVGILLGVAQAAYEKRMKK